MQSRLRSSPVACSISGPAIGAILATPWPPLASSPSRSLPCLSSTSASTGVNSPLVVRDGPLSEKIYKVMKPVYPNSAGGPVSTWRRTPSGNSGRISSGTFPENTNQWAPLRYKFNIGIIGGGIGGVAAAVALHRAGIQATVYEKGERTTRGGRRHDALAQRNARPEGTRSARKSGDIEWTEPAYFLVRSRTGTIPDGHRAGSFRIALPALCTRRSDLLDALMSALPAGRVRLGHDFEYFERQKSSVGIHFSKWYFDRA